MASRQSDDNELEAKRSDSIHRGGGEENKNPQPLSSDTSPLAIPSDKKKISPQKCGEEDRLRELRRRETTDQAKASSGHHRTEISIGIGIPQAHHPDDDDAERKSPGGRKSPAQDGIIGFGLKASATKERSGKTSPTIGVGIPETSATTTAANKKTEVVGVGIPEKAFSAAKRIPEHAPTTEATAVKPAASFTPNADREMEEIKRRERERGPSMASTVTPRPRPPTTNTTMTSAAGQRKKPSTAADKEMQRVKNRERGPTMAAAVVTARKPPPRRTSTTPESTAKSSSKTSSDADMEAIKRRERERGPSMATAAAAVVARRPATTAASKTLATTEEEIEVQAGLPVVQSQTPNADREMEEIKRRARGGPSTAAAVASRPGTAVMERSSTAADAELLIAKRTALLARGPSMATASAVAGRPTSTTSSTPDRKPSAADKELENAKRTELNRGPSIATASVVARRPPAPTVSEESLEDSALLRMRQEAAKLTEHDSGPSLATATSGEIQPGGFAIVNRELNEKEQEQQLAAGQQVDLEAQAGVPVVFSGGSEDIEAQTGVPMPIFPGAFAIAGVDNDDDGSTSESESSDLDDAVSNTGSEPQPFAQVQPSELPTEALEAELHEEVIVEGAVVNFDDDHEGLDQKSRRRLRTIQLIVLCFSCAAIAMVVASVLGGFSASGSAEDELVVEGWTQVGSDVYGPIEEPQTLFGSAVAMSADGTILAVTAPGTDDGTSLNVGEVRIFQESQNETETTWTELKKIQGPGPSNDHVSSLAMSTDANWLAVGYPRLMEGSRVQLYGEVLEGAWVPVLDPIVGPGDGDEEWFGYAVDLSAGGDILAIGAPKMNQNGAVQIYRRTDSAWEQIGEDIVGHQPEEYFGWSVTLQATDGLRVAVGAPVSNDFTGLVRIFDWDGTAWEQVGEDLLGDISLDRFGESVSLSADGKVLAVGAVQQFEPGQAHVFREVGGQWVKDKNTFVGEEDGEGFGSSVALSSDGNVLAIGGPKNSAFGDSTGRVQVLKYDQETAVWVQEGSNIGHEDMSGLGSAVALSADGTRVAAGAPNTAYVGSIPRAGSVQVYDRDIEDEGEDAQE